MKLQVVKDYVLYIRHIGYILSVIKSTYTNWPQVVISLALKSRAVGRARDGSIWAGDAHQIFDYAKLLIYAKCKIITVAQDNIELQCDKCGRLKIINWRGDDLFNMIVDYCNIFGSGVKGRRILDIGAYVGDSTLLLKSMGATEVVAVEPSPWAISVARKNLELNGVTSGVILVNCAVVRDPLLQTVSVPNSEVNGSFSIKSYNSYESSTRIPACTLDSLIEKYGPFDVLKMDCEGCEHDSIPYSKKLNRFKEIFMEYHGGYKDIEEKLRQEGFEVMFSRGIVAPKLYKKAINLDQGYIYAFKGTNRDQP